MNMVKTYENKEPRRQKSYENGAEFYNNWGNKLTSRVWDPHHIKFILGI